MPTTRDFGYTALRLPPARPLLSWLGRQPGGFRVLNRLSGLKSVYPSFKDAWTACQQTQRVQHQNSQLVSDVFQQSVQTRPSDYPALFWLSRIAGGQPLNVFDFGGGAGQSYYQYSRLLPTGMIGRWTILDLPAVIEQARLYAREQAAKSLHFAAALHDAAGNHVFHTAGAFHYWETSIADLVAQTGRMPDHVVINRSPFRDKGPSFHAVQRGHNWAVPCKIWNLQELAAEFAEAGYRLIDQWPVLEKSYRLALLPDFDAPYRGVYFARQALA